MVLYPWYQSPNQLAEIEQGDILFNFTLVEPIIKMDHRSKRAVAQPETGHYIVISHSCDIADKTLDEIGVVQLLPLYGYKEFIRITSLGKSNQGNLQSSRLTTHHMLEKPMKIIHQDVPDDHYVIDFMNMRIASINDVRKHLRRRTNAPPRLRLAHPYNEKMAFRFSSIYSRVALPIDMSVRAKIDPVTTTSTQ